MEPTNIFMSESHLEHIIFSIFTLLFSSHLFGHLFAKLNLPRVVGEICGGILLGPSVLGVLAPTLYSFLFHSFSEQGKMLSLLYWIGLMMLMFTTGFKVNRSLNSEDQKIILNLLISATFLPVIGGIIYFYIYDFSSYQGNAGSETSLLIIVCIAIAVTSIPVISKIFIDLNVIESRFAKIVLATSTIQDLILWIALGVALNFTPNSNSNPYATLFITTLFLGISLSVGPILTRFITNLKGNIFVKSSPIAYVLSVCFIMSVLASLLGVNIVFGALIGGMLIGSLQKDTCKSACKKISSFSLAFFVPIYFSIVGLKINLLSAFDLNLFLSFLFISSFLEIGSVYLGLRAIKLDSLSSINFGFAMNTRGGPGIILASIAYEFSIINEAFFVTLVLVAIVTSLISGAWFRFVIRQGWPLFHPIFYTRTKPQSLDANV